MSRTALAKKKPKALKTLNGQRLMAAGQFKAKCFRIMDEVPEPGKPLVATKRGKPVIEVLPARPANKEEGRRKIRSLADSRVSLPSWVIQMT